MLIKISVWFSRRVFRRIGDDRSIPSAIIWEEASNLSKDLLKYWWSQAPTVMTMKSQGINYWWKHYHVSCGPETVGVSVCMYSSPLCRGLSNAYYESQTSQDNIVHQHVCWSNFVKGQVLIHCRIQIRLLLIDSQKRFYNLLPLEDSVQLLYLHWTCAGWLPPSASLPQRAVSTISVIVSLLYLSAW